MASPILSSRDLTERVLSHRHVVVARTVDDGRRGVVVTAAISGDRFDVNRMLSDLKAEIPLGCGYDYTIVTATRLHYILAVNEWLRDAWEGGRC